MKGYRLRLIRHGMTKGNLEGRYIGKTDLPLAQEGKQQLDKLIVSHEYGSVQKLYSSPLGRCIQTAEILYPATQIQPVEDLREMDFGAFEGKTAQELSGTPAYRDFLKGGLDNPPPGGETARSAVTRSFHALSLMIADMMENGLTECAAITHGGIIMNMLAGFGLPKRRPLDYPCDFGCGYEILITAAMWQRSGAFEILGAFPYEHA